MAKSPKAKTVKAKSPKAKTVKAKSAPAKSAAAKAPKAIPRRAFPPRPIFGVGAVIFQKQAVLLIQRGRAPLLGHWSLPGGAQKIGERVAEALKREVREETGLEIAPGRLITVVDIIERNVKGQVRYHYSVADYLCRVTGGALKAGGDAANVRWVHLGNLDKLKLTPKVKRVILNTWKNLKSI